MKVKVSDYVASFLASHGINQVFSVVGGGSMHLNDSLGHHPQIDCLYNHHEQACAMAAEAYARVHNQMAVVCVTSGPGTVNALTGVVGAYQDSIPMLVLSGQAKTTLSLRTLGLPLRTIGGQEVDIVPAIRQNMVKYAEMIDDPKAILRYLTKAYQTAVSGRPGPSWLDIPLDVQGAMIDTAELYSVEPDSALNQHGLSPNSAEMRKIWHRLRQARRPVLYAGNGIRLAGGTELFHRLVHELKIPVVTCWNSIDLIANDDPYYCGRGGNMGDRAGNFAVQNSDCLLCIGTRLSVYQVGWNLASWARAAYTIVVDIDPEELKKPTIRVDFPVCADASEFMTSLMDIADRSLCAENNAWLKQCQQWKESYPVVQSRQREEKTVNVYAFMDCLSHLLPENAITVAANGSASVVGSQTYYIKGNDRFLMNCALSSMGYALPASIGACVANERQPVVCIEGDGSLMMNLQELQTVVTNRLPIKIFVINNNGYHQVRQTQTNLFPNRLVGMGPESGDLGFPTLRKIADAFDIPYYCVSTSAEMKKTISTVLGAAGYVLCEVVVSTEQKFEPKSATKRLPDGTLVSPPLEDMAPFLPREELARNMYIPLWPEITKTEES